MATSRGIYPHKASHRKTRIELTSDDCIHAGKIVCDECGIFLRWASKRQVKQWKKEQGVSFTLPDIDDLMAEQWDIKIKFAYRDGDELVVDYENYGFGASPMALIRWRQLQTNSDVVDVCLIAERRQNVKP